MNTLITAVIHFICTLIRHIHNYDSKRRHSVSLAQLRLSLYLFHSPVRLTKMACEFQGKRVLVTGGARGLGEAIVKQFAEAGANVFAMDREEALLGELKAKYPSVTIIVQDLLDWEGTKKAVDAIAPIHHLVNNAGISAPHFLPSVDEKLIDRMFDINFKSMINVSQSVVKGQRDHGAEGGTIVNVSSTLATRAYEYTSMYCCSKAAVTMLTKCMALEFGPYNVRVNCIRPSFMQTGLVGTPDVMAEMTRNVVAAQIINKLLQTDQTADLVIFLSSEKSAMITAEEILIDGGLLAN